MGKDTFTSHRIEDRSYVAFVKREIHERVALGSFKESKAGEIDILVSELTSNLIKHAERGELLYRLTWENERDVFEIFCIDNGPGMSNVPNMLRDGVSTTNTLGQGLGAIQRLSDFSRIYSIPEWGTIVYARVYSSPVEGIHKAKNVLENTVIEVPKPGELVCGDGYAIREMPGETCIFLGDGLGHGLYAQEAVQAAIRAFHQCPVREPVEMLRFIHSNVKKTRGLVATIACLKHKERTWRVCGIGNIHTRLFDGLSFKSFMPYNGIIGHNLPTTLNAHQAEASGNQFLVMASDGLGTRWDLAKYPTIFKQGASIVAAALYKDFCRGHDDASVLVSKITI